MPAAGHGFAKPPASRRYFTTCSIDGFQNRKGLSPVQLGLRPRGEASVRASHLALFQKTANGRAEERRTGCGCNHHELKRPEIVIRRIGRAVCHDEACVGPQKSAKDGQRHPSFLPFYSDGKQKAGDERQNRKAISWQQIVTMFPRGIRLEFPEEHGVQHHTDHHCNCVPQFL